MVLNKKTIYNICDYLSAFFYSAVIFLVPVFFTPFLANNNIFLLSKLVLFKVLVLFLAIFTLAKLLFSKHLNIIVKKIIFVFFLLVFLAIFSLNLLFSSDFYLSFFGSYERGQGLLTYLYYFLFFVLVLFNLKNFKDVKRILAAVGLSSFAVGSYALLQASGIDFVTWSEPALRTGRTFSALGQPNFLGSFLILTLPVLGYLVWLYRNNFWRWFWMLALLVSLLALLSTQSRSAWLGLFLSCFCGFLLFFYYFRDKFKNKLKITILVFFIFFVVFSALSQVPFFKNRVLSGFDLNSGSVAARINFWQAGWEAIFQKPWFGYGLENQKEALIPYYQKDWAVHSDVNVSPNRAHNLFLDILLTGGFFGLIVWLVFLLWVFLLLLNNLNKSLKKKKPEIFWLNFCFFLSLLGYFITLLLGFSVLVTNIYFWLYLALLAFFSCILSEEPKKLLPVKPLPKKAMILAFLLLSGLSGYLIWQNYNYLVADIYFKELNRTYKNKNYFKSLSSYQNINRLNNKDYFRNSYISLIYSDWREASRDLIYRNVIQYNLRDEIDNIIPNNYLNLKAKAKGEAILATSSESEHFTASEKSFEELIDLNPKKPNHYYDIAKLYLQNKLWSKAIENFNKSLFCLPSLDSPGINSGHKASIRFQKYLNYSGLAQAYFAKKNYEKAEEFYWQAYKNNLGKTELYKKIADTYYKRGEPGEAIKYNLKAYSLQPDNYVWPFSVALLYQEKDNQEKALQYAQEALSLSPDNEKIKKLIKKLN